MKLYYSPGACSLAPHIVLREAGAAFDLVRVDTRAKKLADGGDFTSVNPKGYVPVLELNDGDRLTEGVVIQQYIADQNPSAKLAPAHGTKERLKLEEWLVFLSTEVHKTFSPIFGPTTPDETKTQAKDQVGQRFDYIEKTLGDGRQYLTGNSFTVADAYLFTLSNWTRFVGMDLGRWPKLSALAGRIAARPAVQAALKAEGLA